MKKRLTNDSVPYLSAWKGDNVCVTYASDILKRNTDSIRCAVETDVFSSLPDESLLDELEMRCDDEE